MLPRTVTQIQAAESAIETPWQNQLTALQAQDTVFTSLGSDLSTLTTSLQALTDFTGVMSQKEGSSSNDGCAESDVGEQRRRLRGAIR